MRQPRLLAFGAALAFLLATLAARSEPRYLLFWRSPEQAAELVRRIGTRGDGKTRLLGFGLPCSTFPLEQHIPQLVRSAFKAARDNDLAVMLHFDFHVDWQCRPDLWNWFDPQKPGFNPENRRNVEWFGWDGPPARVRYLNWGKAERMAPPMCYTSEAVRAEWRRLIRDVIVPAVKPELARLRREAKERLFAGILVGSEPTFDNYARTDPESAKLAAEDGTPLTQTGYRALLDRGFSKDKPPSDMGKALADIIQETVAYWCRQFVEAGIPRSKLYTHIPAGADEAMTCSPPRTAFNRWSRPGWSTYAVGSLEEGFAPLYAELRKHGNPPWGGVEANAGFLSRTVDWETYLAWHYNHGGVLVGINTGATGVELPDRLEKSAFSDEALATYRKWLAGGTLIEKPVSADRPENRLRDKMRLLQEGFAKWLAEGRDPSPIARDVERELTTLLQSGRVVEAEAVLDRALQRMKDGKQTGSCCTARPAAS